MSSKIKPSGMDLRLEVWKTRLDVVLKDLNLYVKIDGIETSIVIRSRFDVPVIYV